jgi:hypothetical protein
MAILTRLCEGFEGAAMTGKKQSGYQRREKETRGTREKI